MTKKEKFLKNVASLSDNEIVEALRTGFITKYELSKTGQIGPLRRRRIEQMLDPSAAPQQTETPVAETYVDAAAPAPLPEPAPRFEQPAAAPAPSPAPAPVPPQAPMPPAAPVAPQQPTAPAAPPVPPPFPGARPPVPPPFPGKIR